jgi:hypothetical protein
MIGIGENDLHAAGKQIFSALGSNRCVRADRHEGGRQYFVVLRAETRGSSPRSGRGRFELKVEAAHGELIYRVCAATSIDIGVSGAIIVKTETATGHWPLATGQIKRS